MLKPLRVLMIEDLEDDALLVVRTLKKGGYEPVYERVETAPAMQEALQYKSWDVILCDYNLPGFSGIDAIALLKKMDIDIPLIIVSGAIGEETAVECMRHGAQDYIMKNNLPRLVSVVERELAEAQSRNKRKEAEDALFQSEEKYRTILESIEDGYFESDLRGSFTFFNNSMCRIWGYPEEEMMGMNSPQFTDKETANRLYQFHNRTYKTGEPSNLIDHEIIRKDGTKRYVQTSFSLRMDLSGNAIGFRGIARDITKLKKMEGDLRESLDQLRKSLGATIHAMAVTVETRDPYTAGHQRRVSDLARTIAVEMGLGSNLINGLRWASTIHDLGKISIPAEILTKPVKLTNIEYQLVQTHSQAGYDILKDIEFPWPIARIVLEHHERIDGSGYPNHRKGEDVLQESKILMVADVVEAMGSHRPYRPSLGIEVALEEIAKNKGILYDADVVDTCHKLFKENRYKLVE